jgi:hypothetical protein
MGLWYLSFLYLKFQAFFCFLEKVLSERERNRGLFGSSESLSLPKKKKKHSFLGLLSLSFLFSLTSKVCKDRERGG